MLAGHGWGCAVSGVCGEWPCIWGLGSGGVLGEWGLGD